MCGILGAVGPSLDGFDVAGLLHDRGPDVLTVLREGNVTVYHSRLAVVATTDASGDQPILLGDSALVCNGFISNAPDVYRSLGLAPSPGDCRALLEAYAARGTEGFNMLQGQFAAAIVDRAASELVLARDPTGICPLYYMQTPSGVVFASQASWLLAYLCYLEGETPTAITLDPGAMASWSAIGYALGPQTLITPIREVAGGTAAAFSLRDGAPLHAFEWARLPQAAPSVADGLRQAVARNLAGDYHPWVLLSGGLDSMLLLHCAVECDVRPTALTLSYPDGSNADEVAVAQQIARYYGVELIIEPFPPEGITPTVERFRGRVDWPVDGGSLMPKAYMADLIHKRGGRVVLGGTGADELFGGYARHQARLELLDGRDVATDSEEIAYYFASISRYGRHPGAWERFCRARDNDVCADPAFVYDILEISQYHNLRVDSCFANVGVEYRPVFQDSELLAAAAALPLRAKSEIGRPKRILRDAFRGDVPDAFIDVPKKPLRFGEMGPTPQWRDQVFSAWLHSRPVELER